MARLIKGFLAVLFFCTTAFAFDTYFFKVPIDATLSKPQAISLFGSKGTKASPQPFYNTFTYILPKDTSCVIVQMTPQTDAEFQDVKNMFGMPGVELWKEFRITPDGIETIADNSDKILTDVDWSVVVSSAGIKPVDPKL